MMEKWLLPPADYGRVHEASSESEALLVQRILHDAGIPAVVRSRQVPGYAEVIRRAIGVWGDVLVPVEHRTDARRYVDDYLRAMKEAGPVSRFAGIIPPIVTLFDERGGSMRVATRGTSSSCCVGVCTGSSRWAAPVRSCIF